MTQINTGATMGTLYAETERLRAALKEIAARGREWDACPGMEEMARIARAALSEGGGE